MTLPIPSFGCRRPGPQHRRPRQGRRCHGPRTRSDKAVDSRVTGGGLRLVQGLLAELAYVRRPLGVDATRSERVLLRVDSGHDGTSPVDRHHVNPKATASSPASDPSYPMTTRQPCHSLQPGSAWNLRLRFLVGQVRYVCSGAAAWSASTRR